MDFVHHQSRARWRSIQLILLFLLAVLMVVGGVNLAGAAIWFLVTGAETLPEYFLATNSFVVLLFVAGSSWVEWTHLEQGGATVAHQLGARTPNPYDIRHKRLCNVTEEVAISAGIAVPVVFVLEHDSINALAAGCNVSQAAIVVTEGALQTLTRDELQGVIAHEVAHIVNGDAAMNTRLTGALYGLYSLHLLGRNLLAAAWTSARAGPIGRHHVASRDSTLQGFIPVPLLLAAGTVLCVIGWLGKIAGHLVQAGVSRQREYLADASAVALTRSKDGLGGALRKIAGQAGAEQPDSPYSELVAHFWLRSDQPNAGWFDSHPPIIERVRRVYGRPLPAVRPMVIEVTEELAGSRMPALNPLPFPAAGAMGLANWQPSSAGADPLTEPAGQETREAAGVQSHLATGESPAAVLFATVRDPEGNEAAATRMLNAIVAGPVSLADEIAWPDTDAPLNQALQWLEQPQGQWLRVPLLEALTGRLRHWPLQVRQQLLRQCHKAVLADGRVEKTEWIYFTLVHHRLLPARRAAGKSVTALDKRKSLASLFSMAATMSPCSAREVREVMVQAARSLGVAQPAGIVDQLQFSSLTRALDVFADLPPLKKPALLRALQQLQGPDPQAQFSAFLVAVAAAIDCPPLQTDLPDQKGAGQFSDWQMVS